VAENRKVAYFIRKHPQTDKESVRVYLNGVCPNEEMFPYPDPQKQLVGSVDG